MKKGTIYRITILARIILCVGLILFSTRVYADNDAGITASPHPATIVSPYYFGPNAFPIPDILTHTEDKLKISLGADYHHGTNNNGNTADILLKANIPLWTERANLSLWWVVNEWYKTNAHRGTLSGDVYVSIDMLLMQETQKRPSWTMRAALKTASGGGYGIKRYYDSAGYFFDTYFGKKFSLGNDFGLQLCAGGGFLCWQTDNGQQNDAVQYGALLGLRFKNFEISETFSGYCGWQSNSKHYGKDAHDCPMSLKTKISYTLGKGNKWDIFAMMQNGLMDYPYNQFQLGVSYSIDILHKSK